MLPREGDEFVGIPLSEPDASHAIGLVASDRDPLPPVVQAPLNIARRLEIAATIDRLSTG
jgi:hypothetical protein